ncbi:MAG: hypothetical protein E7164_01805 [Firmicutes bacterium]|nr:hypothetical protein [Bacillota bacterium]
MKELEKLLQLGKDYKIESQEEKNEGNIINKTIYVSCKKKKDKCPVCNTYTSSWIVNTFLYNLNVD